MAIEGYMSGWTPDHVEEDGPPEERPEACELCEGSGEWRHFDSREGVLFTIGAETCPLCGGSGYDDDARAEPQP